MDDKRKSRGVGGVILIVIGLLALLGQFVDVEIWDNVGLYILPVLGAIFLVWGIAARNMGPIIPGGILSGLGLGIILVEKVSWPETVDEGGVFLLAFALGWALITVLTAVFTAKTQWWPLIPGGIIAVIGFAILFGGIFWQALNLMNIIWPLLLIALGLFVIFNPRRGKRSQEA